MEFCKGHIECHNAGMAKFLWILVPMIFLFGCSDGERPDVIPSNAEVARVETALGKHRCVGSLDKWERHYRYHTRRTAYGHSVPTTNFGAIEFHLRRVETASSQPGMVVHAVDPPHPFPTVVPRERTLSGEFTLLGGRLAVKGC